MQSRDPNETARCARTIKRRAIKKAQPSPATPLARTVPQVFEVVVVCRHEAEQRAVYERMSGEGFRCRVMVL